MAKRFTEADKWRDPWFRQLPTVAKLIWLYLCDRCDAAGVWEIDLAALWFDTGLAADNNFAGALKLFGDRVQLLDERRLVLTKFVSFQYPRGLDARSHAQRRVIDLLRKHGLPLPPKMGGGMPPKLGRQSQQEEDTDTEEEVEEDKDTEDLFAKAVRDGALVVSSGAPPSKTVGDLVALGASVKADDRADWDAAIRHRSFEVMASAVSALRARGAKAWLNVVLDEIDKTPNAGEEHVLIDGVRHKLTKR